MLEKLRYFEAVVRLNSFSKAAKECSISQSAISQHIASLERELGYALLIRKHRSFTPSPAGEYFYQKISVLLEDMDMIVQECQRIARPDANQVQIGILEGMESYCSDVLEAFRTQNPTLQIQICFGDHEALFQKLRKDEVDLVVSDQRRAFSSAYRNEVLCSLPWKVDFGEPDAPESVDLHSLRHHPCVVLCDSPAEQEYLHNVLGIEGPYLKTDSEAKAHLLAAAGQGIYLCSSPDVYPLLMHEGVLMSRTLCCFSKIWNQKPWIDAFINLMHKKFISIEG